MTKEEETLQNQKEGKEIQQLRELYLWEQRMEQERQKEERKNLMQAHMVVCNDI